MSLSISVREVEQMTAAPLSLKEAVARTRRVRGGNWNGSKKHLMYSQDVTYNGQPETIAQRIAKAESAMFTRYKGTDEVQMVDFLTDLLHLCKQRKLSFNQLLSAAKEQFNKEK